LWFLSHFYQKEVLFLGTELEGRKTEMCKFNLALIAFFITVHFSLFAQPATKDILSPLKINSTNSSNYSNKEIAIESQIPTSLSQKLLTLFKDMTEESGVGALGNNHSVAFGDYNGDGFLDIYIVRGNWEPNILYRNNGDMTFADVTWLAGVGDSGYGYHGMFGDYDNDGDLDIYVVNSNSPNVLYQNNGNGIFTDVAQQAGVANGGDGRGAIFFDYDNDGFLDIYVTNTYDQANVLFRNDHYGSFIDVTEEAGVGDNGDGNAIAPGDFDNDGDVDLYVVNFRDQADVLFQNNGNGTFTNISDQAGIENKGWGLGTAFADLDGDGLLDIYVTNHYNQSNVYYHNNGDGTFTNIAEYVGLADQSSGRGVTLGDFDNDGDLDIYVANYESNFLYANENGEFVDLAQEVGVADSGNTYGVAFCDLDFDGFLDLNVVNWKNRPNSLYHNEGNSNHWIVIRTQGTNSNRDGIGTRIRIVTQNKSQIREVTGGCGYLCQDSYFIEFGLGDSPSIDSLIVTWPSGIIDVYTGIAVNQYVTVIEGISLVPVELFLFRGDLQGETIILGWQTKTEFNNYGFEIERSFGGDWETIGFVSGHGTTSKPQKYEFVDRDLNPNISLANYRLKQIDMDGSFQYSKVITIKICNPNSFKIKQNFPNPFNSSTTIHFEIPEDNHIRIEIFNSCGEKVKTLMDNKQEGGNYYATWDGKDEWNNKAASGIYLCRMISGDYIDHIKMLMIK